MNAPNPDGERGIQYADGGVGDGRVFYPNPERIQQFHDEWDAFDVAVEIEVARRSTIDAIYRPSALLAHLERRKR